MLDCLAQANNAAEFQARIPEALEILRRHMEEIHEGRVPFEELIITRTLSKDPTQYVRGDAGAIAAKALARAGVQLHPGEQIGHLILDRKAMAVRFVRISCRNSSLDISASWSQIQSPDIPAPNRPYKLPVYFGGTLP